MLEQLRENNHLHMASNFAMIVCCMPKTILCLFAGVSTVCMFLEVRYLRIVLWFQPLYFLYLKRTHYSVTH